eukprot:m.192521 g.192521  ORF g.192521 m.192521 type:complete len:94 (+) comp14856_c0_seq2:3166-3447(+)
MSMDVLLLVRVCLHICIRTCTLLDPTISKRFVYSITEAQNIVDGDLVEMLLHLDEPTIAQVVRNFQIPTDSGVMRDVTSDELQQLIQNVIAIA